MANIIKFPRQHNAVVVEARKTPVTPTPKSEKTGVGATVIKGVWMLTVLIWPILKWVVSLDCVFQLVRMMYHWDTPGVYAGWTFLLYFGVLTALTYFVSVYEPKGFRQNASK